MNGKKEIMNSYDAQRRTKVEKVAWKMRKKW
jgi:hypothetical protein